MIRNFSLLFGLQSPFLFSPSPLPPYSCLTKFFLQGVISKEAQKEESFIKELSLVCVKPCLTQSQDDLETIVVNEDAFSSIAPILQRYVAQEKESDTKLETAVLDSMQKLFAELSFPRGTKLAV